MLSEVPEGWSLCKLGDIASIVGGTTPKKSVDEYWSSEDILWATPTDITSLPIGVNYIDDTQSKASLAAVERGGLKVNPAGTVLMTSRATIGYVAISSEEMATNQGFANFLPNKKYVPLFMLYLLRSKKQEFIANAGGSTFKEIGKGVLNNLKAMLPPLKEQKRIAEILSSVDASIQATQAVIDQAERVKRGLMEDLLTGGLGSEAIERGEVPKGWKNRPLSSLANFINGRAFKPSDWTSEGLPIIRIAQINEPFSDYNCYNGDDVDSKYLVTKGDLLFSWSATLTATIWQHYDAILNQHIFKVEEKSGVERKFLFYRILQSIDELLLGAHGTTMRHIKKRELDVHHVPTPPLNEQKRIAGILSSMDDFIARQHDVVSQWTTVKSGLMDDLLTGRVRTV